MDKEITISDCGEHQFFVSTDPKYTDPKYFADGVLYSEKDKGKDDSASLPKYDSKSILTKEEGKIYRETLVDTQHLKIRKTILDGYDQSLTDKKWMHKSKSEWVMVIKG